MFVYGQLQKAQIEQLAADPANTLSYLYYNTVSNEVSYYDGTAWRVLVTKASSQTLTNKNLDDTTTFIVDTSDPTKKINFNAGGTTATKTTLLAAQTADRVLTLPDATDTLAALSAIQVFSNKEFSDSILLDQISTPATPASLKNRLYFKSDNNLYALNSSGSETQVSGTTTSTRLNAIYTVVIGSAAQVTSGVATHSTWASGIAAASAGDRIKVLPGTWTENVSLSKNLSIEGSGYGSVLTGTFTAASGSSYSGLLGFKLTGIMTLQSGANGLVGQIWQLSASNAGSSDNGDGTSNVTVIPV